MSSKRVLQKLVAYVMYYWIRFRWDSEIPLALYYHRVFDFSEGRGQESSNPLICITKELFEAQMRYLSANANLLTLNDFVEGCCGRKRLPKKSILITFDDGYLDNFQCAFPVLKKYRVPATIFLTSDRIGLQGEFWWDALYGMFSRAESLDPFMEAASALNWSYPFDKEDGSRYGNGQKDWKEKFFTSLSERMKNMQRSDTELVLTTLKKTIGVTTTSKRNFLSWEEIRDMSNHGVFFGSHSCSHANLTILPEKELLEELQASKDIIEEKVGVRVKAFSYPYGLYSEKCKKAVERCAYEVAFTTKPRQGSGDRFSVPRIAIKQERSQGFRGRFSKHLFQVEYKGFADLLRLFMRNSRLIKGMRR